MLTKNPAITGPIPSFNTIGHEEAEAAYEAVIKGPLSGYLGGAAKGGYYVEKLEDEWRQKFGTKHAVSCNSATTGLLMACMAAGVESGDTVVTTPYTMSATAAAPAFLGARIVFRDIEPDTFCIRPDHRGGLTTTIAVNLFGHPAMLHWMRSGAGGFLIEDNAQGILAKENGRYAGTIGYLGVFSGNIHKSVQCGEGGMVVTNDDSLADKLRHARNHGEMAGGSCGLNLRLTEVQAAIWSVQLAKADWIVSDRIATAEAIIEAASGIPGVTPPVTREGCVHTYYCIPFIVDEDKLGMTREEFVRGMNTEGVPMRAGYTPLLYNLPAFEQFYRECPVAEKVEGSIVIYENCSFAPSPKQLKQFRTAFQRVAEHGNSRTRNKLKASAVSHSRDKLQSPW